MLWKYKRFRQTCYHRKHCFFLDYQEKIRILHSEKIEAFIFCLKAFFVGVYKITMNQSLPTSLSYTN